MDAIYPDELKNSYIKLFVSNVLISGDAKTLAGSLVIELYTNTILICQETWNKLKSTK